MNQKNASENMVIFQLILTEFDDAVNFIVV